MNKNKEHLNRKAKIIQWCEKRKDKTINFKIIHKKHDEEQGNIFKSINTKILCIEENPSNPGIFRILFDSFVGNSVDYEFVVFGYEVLDVVEEVKKLIVYKGHHSGSDRIELTDIL